VIGEVTANEGVEVMLDGRRLDAGDGGWRHR